MAKALILSIFVLSFLALGFSTHVKFKVCSGTAKILFVDVTPCPEEPCQLKKGTEEKIEIQFIPSTNITAATTVVHGIVSGVPVPFPVANPNACKEHGITCPMTAGTTYTFNTVLPIKSGYPAIKLVVKWEMLDQDDNDVFCFELPVAIVS